MTVGTTHTADQRLVGRQLELAELEWHLERLRTAGTEVLAICGEPGIGKTRLLAELAARARARGFLVLSGRALEFESEVPFAPLVDALDEHLGSLDARRLRRLDAEQLAELAAVFPALAGRPGAERPALEAERYRLHRAARELLDTLARGRPLVLALDDLHWADDASLELLAYLLRRPPHARLLVALAFRPRQAPAALIAALDSAARADEPVRTLELGPLSEPDMRALLTGRGLDADDCRAIHAHSGGNPFYADQLARAGLRGHSPPDVEAPTAVAAALAGEIAGLDTDARALLLAAAVAGDPFDAGLAGAVAALNADRASALLDELCARDLLRPADAPGRFAFRHPIVRAALYGSAPNRDRLAAHARAAAALERRGATPAAIAHHLERCAQPGDTGAAERLARAADEAVARAPATAARWYQAALALQPRSGAPARRELLVALARALAAAGRLEAARERVEQALSVAPADPAARSELIALCAGLDQQLGRHADAHARLAAALAELPPHASAARLALQTELALQPAYAYQASEHSTAAARALAAAAHEHRADQASVLATLALRATLLGDIPDALAHAARAADLVDALDEHELAGRLDALHRLGGAELHLNRYPHAVRHLDRGVALARATGQGRFLIPMLAHLAAAHATLGQLAQARRSIEDALDTARLAGPPSLLLWALIYAGLSETQAGDQHSAHAHAREAHELAERLPPSSFTAKAHALLATTHLELGDPEHALALFDRSAITHIHQHEAALRTAYWEALVRALLALHRRDDAARVLERVDAAIAPLQLPMPRAHGHRAHAHLLLADGDAAHAAHHARAAAALAEQVGAVIEAARARTLAGQALAAAGDTDAAAELERAHRALAACGADGHRDQAARALRRLGHRVRRPSRPQTPTTPRQLTQREHQIAQLVADGLTNQQIARELHLSTKTVEMHLTRTYAKLGIARRAALARTLADASTPTGR